MPARKIRVAHLPAASLIGSAGTGATAEQGAEAVEFIERVVADARNGAKYAHLLIADSAAENPEFVERARQHYGFPEGTPASIVVARFCAPTPEG
ncbi:MAG: hypothetical protein AAF089_15570 [Bacteroidota bacterium]